jgi:tRNA G18 (ribose-2'-O)-methylase SpoU
MTNQEIGVGPHPEPWPIGEQYDTELLEHGDRRNVEDTYRYWTVEAIKADLDKHRFDFHVAIENWQHDMNIGTIVRAANAFNAAVVHVIGKKHWNRRGAMVTDRYLTVYHHATVDDFLASLEEDRRVVAVDTFAEAQGLSETTLPEKVVFVFGGEGPGLSGEMREKADAMVKIEQFGSTRSVNVGVAAGIVMYTWLERHVLMPR